MTVLELNELAYISANIKRIIQHLESGCRPDFFIADGTQTDAPIAEVFKSELEDLMREYKRRIGYIEGIRGPWMKRIFALRFLEQKSFQEIGVEYGIMGGTLKQEVYSFLRRNPEGYVSCRDLADEWGVNIDTVNHWCRIGAFPGAKKRRGSGSDGHRVWIIPEGVTRPDKRR